jgi:hypothetical protein
VSDPDTFDIDGLDERAVSLHKFAINRSRWGTPQLRRMGQVGTALLGAR